MIYNVSTGCTYFSQRDNKVRPLETCGPTSLAMALVYSKVQLPVIPEGSQLEDVITEFLATNKNVQDYYQRNFVALYREGVPANEVHAVAAYGVNLWLSRPVFRFTVEASMKDVLFRIAAGTAVPMSGVWDGLRHIVCVVGCETDQDLKAVKTPQEIQLSAVKSILVDDPYGNYATKYKNPDGDDIVVPYADFIKITRTQGMSTQKWAYLIS